MAEQTGGTGWHRVADMVMPDNPGMDYVSPVYVVDADTARETIARAIAEWLAAWDGDSIPAHYDTEAGDLADAILAAIQETP